ncbi:ABC transporter ATP-binding protein [Rhodopila sp.]|uniref:ABC transporter ATP-binding protein n=1 Tax=Rhodopila sp. TaxID=2480087 RepID=UPI003D0CDF83
MIVFENVSKVYHTRSGQRRVLDDVSFSIGRGQSIGIVGRNGAGKSTLTRLMAGIEFPTRGQIRRDMSVSWPIGFGGAFQSSLTGADNARFIARIYRKPIDYVLGMVEDFAGLGEYYRMPVKTYSSGMKARLAFAVSLAVDFDCYIVDEITAVGDASFRDRCADALRSRREKGTLIMVSHDPNTLRAHCETGGMLQGGHLQFYDTIEETILAYEGIFAA